MGINTPSINLSVSPTGTPAPSSATEIGIINAGGNLEGVSASNPLPISGSISATNPSVGTTGTTAPTSATEIGAIDVNGNLQPVNSLSAGTGQNGLLVALGATNYVTSSNNSSTSQLTAGSTFTGVIESVFNEQTASVLLTVDQPGTLTLNQYIDAGGVHLANSLSFSIIANTPFSRSFVLNGNYANLAFHNTGSSTTTTFDLNVAYGTLPSVTNLGNSPSAINEINGSTVATAASGIIKVGLTDSAGNGISSTTGSLNVDVTNSITATSSPQFQTNSGTLTASSGAGSTVAVAVKTYSMVSVQFSGTFAGVSVAFKQSFDNGATYQIAPVVLLSTTPSAPVASATLANNTEVTYQGNLEGATNFEVVCTAYTSGTVNVIINNTANPVTYATNAAIINNPVLGAGSSTIGSIELTDGTNTANVIAGDNNAVMMAIAEKTTSYTATGSQSANFVVANFDTLGYKSMSVHVTSIGAGITTITVKESGDNTNFLNLQGLSDSSQVPTLANTIGNNALNTFQLGARYIQISLSGTQTSGTTTFTVTLKASAHSPPGVYVSGKLTNNNASISTNNLGVLPVVANAAAQSWSEGFAVALSSDLAGNLRIANMAAVTGGWTPYFANAVKTTVTISGAAGKMALAALINTDSAPVYLQCFDTTGAVTLGSTTPTFVIPYPANGTAANGIADRLFFGDVGMGLANGLKAAATTTATGSSTSTNGLTGTIGYK